MTMRERVLSFLRVPPEPSPPGGDASVRVFRAAPAYLRYRVVVWALREIGALLGVIVYFTVAPWTLEAILPPRVRFGPFVLTRDVMIALSGIIETLGLFGLAFTAIASFLILRLDYEQRWYIVSDRSLRIREGLVSLHEKTMTFANVQQVGIRQNPIQRWLGIADVEVRTAGGGQKKEDHERSSDHHIGVLRGVTDAEGIRDLVQDRLRHYKDSGLGDPDHHAPAPAVRPAARSAVESADLASAAAALRDEARALRRALEPTTSGEPA
jgi:membrane protein YdbS with pleckstrin-like domain